MVNITKHNKQIKNCNLYVITAIIGNKRQKEKRIQCRGKSSSREFIMLDLLQLFNEDNIFNPFILEGL